LFISKVMKRKYVKSSAIISVGYDPESLTLEVEFINSDVYQYFGVPKEDHEALMNAESVGEFFNTVIKPKNFEFNKIDNLH
jgi:hypothetical protein